MTAPLNALLASCALLGFRHGFDYDHIAAITDIAGLENRVARTLSLGLMYALGHAATVAVLGGLVIGFRLALPAAMDPWAERVVGLTLIVLAVYVLSTLVRGKNRPKSRAAILIGAAQWVREQITGTPRQSSPATEVNAGTCFGIGVLHGLGAETPSQLALFLLTANLGGVHRGFAGLAFFLVGLVAMNTLMTASAAGLFSAGRSWRGWYPILTSLTAAYSFAIGVVFLLGDSGMLKTISG